MKRKMKKGQHKIPNLTNTLLKIFKKDPKKTFNYKQLAAKLGVNDPSSRNQIIKKLAYTGNQILLNNEKEINKYF